MTLYEIIKNNAEMGYHSIVQNKDGDFNIVSPFKDYDGNYRDSAFCASLQECSEYIGSFSGWDVARWNHAKADGTKYIGVYQPEPYKLFQPGDKVLVREDAEKWLKHYGLDGHMHLKREMFGKVLEIRTTHGSDYWIWNEEKTDYWLFPPQTLEPYYETTPKVKEMTVAEISEALGYDVKVVE